MKILIDIENKDTIVVRRVDKWLIDTSNFLSLIRKNELGDDEIIALYNMNNIIGFRREE